MKVFRYIAIGELTFIMLPLALVAMWGSVLSVPSSLIALAESWRNFPAVLLGLFCIVGLAALICGSLLLFNFVQGGRQGLSQSPRHAWLLSSIGGATALLGGVIALFGEGIGYAIGLPAVLPLCHMYYERHRVDG